MWKTNEVQAESITLILDLVFSTFLSVNTFLKIWANHFCLFTCESFKASLPLFLTIEEKRKLDLSFFLSARFDQLNTVQKLDSFKFLFLFHFAIIFYSLSSHLLPARPLFLIVLHNDLKNIQVRKVWFVTCIGTEIRIKNAKFSGYCFDINPNIQWNFQIFISVPLNMLMFRDVKQLQYCLS